MGYVNSIGGSAIEPNPFRYSVLSISASVSLGWAGIGQNPTYPATDLIDLTASVGSLVVTMPSALQVAIGKEVVFNNYGAQTVTINDNGGNSITTVTAGQAKRLHLVTNSTAAGTWRVIALGAGTSAADASALAGYGLVALAGQLSQSMPNLSYSSNQTIGLGHRAYLVNWTGGAGTFTLTAPGTLTTGWFTSVHNAGSGSLTITPASGLINGVASITAEIGEGFTIETDGSNFFTVGKIAQLPATTTILNKSVAGGIAVTLTATEAANSILNFTGLLTASINVIVPTSIREWTIYNATTGAFTLTVKTSAGTGIAVTQGTRQLLYCDNTNVVKSNDAGTGTVTSVAAGTGLSGGTITTAGTISLENTAVTAGAYGTAIAVPAITFDAQGRATAASVVPISIPSIQDFRLSLTSGQPVDMSNVTAATTIYCVPFRGNNISLYDGTNWNIRTSAQFSLALGVLTSGKPYDVFCYDNATVPTLEFLAWTNDTTRATALAYQNGILVKSGATTRRYLGTFYTTSTTTTESSTANRYLVNYYNQQDFILYREETTASWTYTTAVTRQANANTANQLNFVSTGETPMTAKLQTLFSNTSTGVLINSGMGYDSITAMTIGAFGIAYSPATASQPQMVYSDLIVIPSPGRHYISWLEVSLATGTTTWYGSGSSVALSCIVKA